MGCEILKVVARPRPRPFQGRFVVGRLGHAMINLPTKFEVRSVTHYGNVKCVATCKMMKKIILRQKLHCECTAIVCNVTVLRRRR